MSQESEFAIIGALLLEPAIMPEITRALKPEDFSSPRHRAAYRTLQTLAGEGVEYDAVIFGKHFGVAEDGQTGNQYAIEAMDACPSTVTISAHVHAVAAASKKRALMLACREVIESGQRVHLTSKAEAESWFAEAQAKLTIDATIEPASVLSAQEAVGETMRMVEERYRARGDLPGMRTGFHRIDDLLLGLQRSHLVLLAGKPAAGKTALALNFAVNVAKAGHGALVCSHEMGVAELMSRILSADAKVPGVLLDTGRLEAEHYSRLAPAAARVGALPLWFASRPPKTVPELFAEAQTHKRRKGLDLVVVDYLQLMDPAERRHNREQAVSEISRGLKRIAMELGVCVLALSQLNRASDRNSEPALSELRESGALEQDANSVLMIWAESDDAPMICGKVAKNRSGQVGPFTLTFRRAIQRFENA